MVHVIVVGGGPTGLILAPRVAAALAEHAARSASAGARSWAVMPGPYDHPDAGPTTAAGAGVAEATDLARRGVMAAGDDNSNTNHPFVRFE